MTFYDRFEMLCAERQMKPQTQEIQDIAGVSSPAISGWKNKGSCMLDVYIMIYNSSKLQL